MAQVRRLGSYAPLSATYYLDDAVIEAGADAELLFARSLAFCASVMSDGYFTEGQLTRFAAGLSRLDKRVDALVKSGLWESAPGGYVIRRWLKWNKSAAEREREKTKDRERKAAQTPAGFQPELEPESDRNPGGNEAGFPSRARADVALHSTSQHVTAQHGTAVAPPPERRRDEVWETMLAVCRIRPDDVGDNARGAYNKAAATLRGVRATPDEIRNRAENFRARWPEASLTPTALARRWAEVAVTPEPAQQMSTGTQRALAAHQIANRLREAGQ